MYKCVKNEADMLSETFLGFTEDSLGVHRGLLHDGSNQYTYPTEVFSQTHFQRQFG